MSFSGAPASFRDPAGFVYTRDEILYRQVNAAFREDFDHLLASGLRDVLVARGALIDHTDVELSLAATPDAYRVIRPALVPFVSYPYEWTFGQLRAAALLTLDVLREALGHGMILRDAMPANVQFVGSRPVFIDTLSFGRYRDGQPWYGYRQFCECFLAPLALAAHRDPRLVGLLRRFPGGVPLDLASALLGPVSRLRLGLLLHVHLHARAQRRYADIAVDARRRRIERPALLRLVEHLRTIVEALDWKADGTAWADYEETHGYSGVGLEAKQAIVHRVLAAQRPRTVWDLGANTGIFSRVAAELDSRVVAIEGDVGAAERHFRRLAASGDDRVLPLLLDLLDPTPALGWAHTERLSLEQRGPADMLLALALVHHLTLGGNVPLPRVAEYFAKIGRRLVIEFVPPDDPQARRLVANRPEAPLPYSREVFEAAFGAWWRTESVEPVGDSGRLIYAMTSRS